MGGNFKGTARGIRLRAVPPDAHLIRQGQGDAASRAAVTLGPSVVFGMRGETVGVQDIANDIVEKISDFVHGGQDSGGAQGGNGGSIHGRLDALKGACETAIQRDQTEAAIHLAASLAAGPITAAITTARAAFDSKAGALTNQLRTEERLLRAAVNMKITPHLGVPNTLQADVAHWSELADRVKGVEKTASLLMGVPGWDDKASPEYAKAVKVQVNALDSLATIMKQVGASCLQGKNLNLYGFTEVEQALAQTTNQIRGTGSGGGSYYQRTAAAIIKVVFCRAMVDPEFLKSVRASVNITNRNSTALVSSDLQAHYWPGGNAPTGIDG